MRLSSLLLRSDCKPASHGLLAGESQHLLIDPEGKEDKCRDDDHILGPIVDRRATHSVPVSRATGR